MTSLLILYVDSILRNELSLSFKSNNWFRFRAYVTRGTYECLLHTLERVNWSIYCCTREP